MTTIPSIFHFRLDPCDTISNLALVLIAWIVLIDPNVLPIFQVRANVLSNFPESREETDLCCNEWCYNKLDETNLRVGLLTLSRSLSICTGRPSIFSWSP